VLIERAESKDILDARRRLLNFLRRRD
jgi:hypothetical protein